MWDGLFFWVFSGKYHPQLHSVKPQGACQGQGTTRPSLHLQSYSLCIVWTSNNLNNIDLFRNSVRSNVIWMFRAVVGPVRRKQSLTLRELFDLCLNWSCGTGCAVPVVPSDLISTPLQVVILYELCCISCKKFETITKCICTSLSMA